MTRKPLPKGPPARVELERALDRVARRQLREQLWRRLAICWGVAALVAFGLGLLERQTGWSSLLVLPVLAVAGVVSVAIVAMQQARKPSDRRSLAQQIEMREPGLDGRLITALQQQPGPDGRFGYLQDQLLQEVVRQSRNAEWSKAVPWWRLALVETGHWAALALFVLALVSLPAPRAGSRLVTRIDPGLTVSPGDGELERGTALVVMARFGDALPNQVDLVIGPPSTETRIPLVKSLGDPLFGTTVPEVASNLVYHVEYSGQRSRDYHVSVFEYPRLEKSDAEIVYPGYTGLPPKQIPGTRRLSAVEGSHVNLNLTFNKPVASAQLIARGKDTLPILLELETNSPSARLSQFLLETNLTRDLLLTDAEGRTNRIPAQFVFQALKNRAPEIKVARPRGDLRPSALEEIRFEGTVWDDFGVQAFGLGYVVAGQEPVFVSLGEAARGSERRSFQHLLRLEELNLKPDELLTWFVWADDIAPDGSPRRTTGDLFFAEIRPFEEIFREGEGMGGGAGGGGEGQEEGQNPTAKLAELQKQIISATWKIQQRAPASRGSKPPKDSTRSTPGKQSRNSGQREFAAVQPLGSLPFKVPVLARMAAFGSPARSYPEVQFHAQAQPAPSSNSRAGSGGTTIAVQQRPAPEADIDVIIESQKQALEDARSAAENLRDPRAAALWQTAVKEMEKAVARLEAARNSPTAFTEALAAEQTAYQAILRLQEHEYQVSRSRSRSQSQGGGRNQQLQQQLQQLDLTQSEDRYETQREAQRPESTQRREQLQVMNRLQELARRQQDLNERLKELQTALQEARTEEERAEIQRRLKRLQEEEQQMLNDVDELRQRMERPENQSRMAEERKQLEQTREDIQRAAEAAAQGAASQALAAGTRAQRQLQEMRERMRQENSSQLSEDLRDLRRQARELSRRQEEIQQKIEAGDGTEQKSLGESGNRAEALEQLAGQRGLITNLVERATQISQQAESSEPILATELYDTVRKFTQDSAKNLKETQEELMTQGRMTRNLYDRLRESSESDASKLEDVASEMLRLGFDPLAHQASERARRVLDDLRQGVERAAERVVGDDTEALRLARKELEELSGQLQRELNQARAEETGTNQTGQAAGGRDAGTGTNATASASSQPGAESDLARNGGAARQPGDRPAGENQQPAQEQASLGERGPTEGSNEDNSGNPTPGQGSRNGERQGEQTQAQAGQGGDQQGQGREPSSNPGNQDGQPGRTADASGDWNNAAAGGGAGGARNWNWDRLLNGRDGWNSGPLTGQDFTPWSDRLREVEEMIDDSAWRNEVAAARDRARTLRQDYVRARKKPEWAVVDLQILKPLGEVRQRIAEELARRDSREALVPIDRDPVPNRYSDLVRKYYEQLGKDK